ncbi:glycosyltransferase family 2 protein [Halovivax sp.]|uniref:glycosyltransferase family 2 protein n=1 Tax=Halovivax sp. TaxID=1935978 RepID=UPI0025C42BE9|nr:glycosyltransferase family A protein [Halovivax sp.]
MKLSVVVSTLNDRERLLPCLDALAEQLPSETETIVVNGPSSDGTTGAVRERAEVDVLVEISDRYRSVSRNAGIEVATGETIAFLGDEYAVEPTWYDAVEAAVEADADVVTGPVKHHPSGDAETEPRRIAGRSVTTFAGDNVAFDRNVIEALDGFDEYLETGSTDDCAHRVAALDFDVTWSGAMAVRSEVGTDGGSADPEWGGRYRSLNYRLAKNYGPRPSVLARSAGSALSDGLGDARGLLSGRTTPTSWFANGVDVAVNSLGGLKDGVVARYRDRSSRKNPNGVSSRHDRAVQVYDRR